MFSRRTREHQGVRSDTNPVIPFLEEEVGITPTAEDPAAEIIDSVLKTAHKESKDIDPGGRVEVALGELAVDLATLELGLRMNAGNRDLLLVGINSNSASFQVCGSEGCVQPDTLHNSDS